MIMAEKSGGPFGFSDVDDMFWDQLSRVRKLSDRDSSGESMASVISKKSRVVRERPKPNANVGSVTDSWKVIVSFETKGGPDHHPMHITKAIQKEIGNIQRATFLGNGRLLIYAKSEEQRKIILKKTTLNNLKISVHVPGTKSRARGVISGIPTSVSVEEIKETLSQYGVTEVKRLTKGKEKIDSLSILLTFDKDLPARVQMGYMSYTVREYVPPPLRCFQCQRFGHVASQCRGKVRCAKCGGDHDYGKCEAEVLKCCNCGGPHSAAYGGCEKQKEAKEVQKCRVLRKMSYANALKTVQNDKATSAPTPVPRSSTAGSQYHRISQSNGQGLLNGSQHLNRPIPEPRKCACNNYITKDTLLVNKNEFIAFLCTVMNTTLKIKRKRDRISSIVEIANGFLGSSTTMDEIHLMINRKYGQSQDST